MQGGGADASGQQRQLGASHSREFTLQATASNAQLPVTDDPMVRACISHTWQNVSIHPLRAAFRQHSDFSVLYSLHPLFTEQEMWHLSSCIVAVPGSANTSGLCVVA